MGESTKLGVNLHGDVTTVLFDTTVGLDLQRLETLSDDRLEKNQKLVKNPQVMCYR